MIKFLLTENMQNNTKKTLKIYWEHAKRYKVLGSIVLFFVVFGAATNVIRPLFYKNFFDILVSGQGKETIVSALIAVLVSIAAIQMAGWISWIISAFTASYFWGNVSADLSNTCFRYLHKHSFSYFNNNFSGSLVKRVSYFPKAFEQIANEIVWNLLPLIVSIVIIIVVLFSKNVLLGLVISLWLVIIVALNWFLARYKLKFDIKTSEAQTKTTGFLSDTIINNGNVKLFCGYQREIGGFAALNEKFRRLRQFAWNLSSVVEAIQIFFLVALEIGIFYVGIDLWSKGKFTVGDFVLLQSYIITIFQQTIHLGKIIREIYQNLADAEEMTIILNTPHEIQDVPRAKKIKVKKGEIEFQDVDFYYHKTRRVLDEFNLTIASSERLALIGPSGAGKTTVIKLLLRNHEVASGKILIDRQDISKVTQESLWSNISLVPQDPILFHRSLMENIRYGKSTATDEEIMEASKFAHCHEFISDLPEKYNTYVGERGIKLSGGERQRVAIARAILRNAPILILDEATSSLDSRSESLIQDALDKLMKNKTVIVIAHRLSTIVKMDRIIFIDEGKIKEEGTHQELLAKKDGQYKKLWLLQAGGFIAD